MNIKSLAFAALMALPITATANDACDRVALIASEGWQNHMAGMRYSRQQEAMQQICQTDVECLLASQYVNNLQRLPRVNFDGPDTHRTMAMRAYASCMAVR